MRGTSPSNWCKLIGRSGHTVLVCVSVWCWLLGGDGCMGCGVAGLRVSVGAVKRNHFVTNFPAFLFSGNAKRCGFLAPFSQFERVGLCKQYRYSAAGVRMNADSPTSVARAAAVEAAGVKHEQSVQRKLAPLTLVVAACADTRGIGMDGTMPWKLSGDMKYFKDVTTSTNSNSSTSTSNAVIMGRNTWESIPAKFRPLPDRINVILTSKPHCIEQQEEQGGLVLTACSLHAARTMLAAMDHVGTIFVIGGGQVYREALRNPQDVAAILLTEVHLSSSFEKDQKKVAFDTFFPHLNEQEWTRHTMEAADVKYGPQAQSTSPSHSYRFFRYTPIIAPVNVEEEQYLNLCRSILQSGICKGDRTGTGTLSQFGVQMRFSLRDDTIPLLTTKRVFWRGVVEELLWFVKGCTDANQLSAKGVKIWDGNGSREFLDQRGLGHREVGDLGPVYGFQWRHFGAKYTDMHADYTGQGVDQLKECIDKIKNNPNDRRIIMSAWNPADLDQMALPPCHMFCQFYVDTHAKELSCQMYQRSADVGLGVPFNIASYALLTHMVAHVCGLKPGEFVHTIGDAHVYLNHVDALKEQLERDPREFPKLKIRERKDGQARQVDEFVFEDFELEGYCPHKSIKMKMAV